MKSWFSMTNCLLNVKSAVWSQEDITGITMARSLFKMRRMTGTENQNSNIATILKRAHFFLQKLVEKITMHNTQDWRQYHTRGYQSFQSFYFLCSRTMHQNFISSESYANPGVNNWSCTVALSSSYDNNFIVVALDCYTIPSQSYILPILTCTVFWTGSIH